MKINEMNAEQREVINNLIEMQDTVAGKKKLSKALGVDYKHPSVREQICAKGKVVHDYKRGRAINGRTMALIPPVTLESGREVPQLAVDPAVARETAFELLRLADSQGW